MSDVKTILSSTGRFLLFSLLLAVTLPASLKATHIVGGEMDYRILSTTADSFTIELSLAIYRDCFFGDPNVYFDDPAHIGIFNSANLRVDSLQIPFTGMDDTLNSPLDACLINLSPVCYHTTNYQRTVTLPRIPGGYTFAYQRCCRNQTIINIISPLLTGATYFVRVNEAAIARANNSPTFTSIPPIYICANEQFIFDQSAIDPDGDSLVYELSTPFNGGTFGNPQPIPTFNPPYDTIIWKQGFSRLNMLGVGQPLRINRFTGLTRALPQALGQYVVGVRIIEYDRLTGDTLSIIRRDFQYNVNPCEEPTAAFFSPEAQCDDLVLTVENQSTAAANFAWYYNLPGQAPVLFSTSSDSIVTTTLPGPGNYTIRLLAEPGTTCVDTSEANVFLQANSIVPDFLVSNFTCDQFSLLDLLDSSIDTIGSINSYQWVVSYNGSVQQTSMEPAPQFEVPSGISGTVTLTLGSANGCVRILSQPFQTNTSTPVDSLQLQRSACIGDTIELNPFTPDELPYTYQWSPAADLINPDSLNPTLIVTGPGVYSVTITADGAPCSIIRQVTVSIASDPQAGFTLTPECDGLTFNVTSTATGGTSIFYDFGIPGTTADTANIANPTVVFPDTGTYIITQIVRGAGGCADTLLQPITIQELALFADFGFSYVNCEADSVTVQLTDQSVNNLNNTTTRTYTLSDGQSSTDPNPTFTFFSNDTITITYTIMTALNCTASVTRDIPILLAPPTDQFPDSLISCGGETVGFPVGGDPDYGYSWTPTAGVSDPTSPNPTFSPGETTVYTVVVTRANDPTCTATETVTVVVPDQIGLMLMDGNGTTIVDGETIITCDTITQLTTTTQVPADVVFTTADGTVLGTGINIQINVDGSQTITVTATDAFGCTETLTATVSGGPADVAIDVSINGSSVSGQGDTLVLCLDDQLDLGVINNDPTDILTYAWSPADLFVDATVENPVFQGGPGIYEVVLTATNQFGCPASDTINFVVIDQDAVLSFTSEVSCQGGEVTFTNQSTVTFGYLWDFGDGTTSTEENPVHVYDGTGPFTVTLSLIYDQDCVDDFSMEVSPSESLLVPDFTAAITDCRADGTATVQVTDISTNSQGGTLTYMWTFSGPVTPTSSTQPNPSLEISGNGTLGVNLTIRTGNNCENQLDTTLTISLAMVDLPMSDTICPGETIGLNPNGNSDFTYSWQPIGSTEVNPMVSPTETTTYTVTVTPTMADLTCSATDSITITVDGPIGLDIMSDVPPSPDGPNGPGGPGDGTPQDPNSNIDFVYTCGEAVTLTSPVNGGATVIYTDINGNPITGNPIVFSSTGIDTLIATATSLAGCIEMDTIVIIGNGVDVTPNPGSITTVCTGTDTTITIVNNDPGDILTYMWEPNDIITGPLDGETISISVNNEGQTVLSVVVSNQFGCDTTIMITVVAQPFMPPVFPQTVAACFGEMVTISGGSAPDGYVYVWTPEESLDLTDPANPVANVDETTTFTVVVSDPETGCIADPQQVTVEVSEEIGFTAAPADTTLCEPGDVTIGGTTMLEGGANIVWYSDADLTDSIGMGSSVTVSVTDMSVTVFGVATDPLTGCADTISSTINYDPITDGFPPTMLDVCAGESSDLIPGGGNSGYVYTYEPDDDLDLTDPSNPTILTGTSQTILVTIFDPVRGCTVETTIMVNATTLDVSGTATPDSILLGESSVLDILGCDSCMVEWEVPNGGIEPPTGPNVTVTPDREGEFIYTATVTEGACTQVVLIPLVVTEAICDPDRFYLPNAFSPNGDGENDELRLRSSFIDQITEFELIVFDRWGEQMYRSQDANGFWNGRFKNDACEPDVYGYWMRLICPTGEVLVQQGNITLLR